MVHIKSHAKPVMKAKKERASRGLLSGVPGTLMSHYLADFQPSFIHTSITISSNPWDKLSVDDAQDLFAAVFPEVTHEMAFGDIFYSPVRSFGSFIPLVLTSPSGKPDHQHDSELRQSGWTDCSSSCNGRPCSHRSQTSCAQSRVSWEGISVHLPVLRRYRNPRPPHRRG